MLEAMLIAMVLAVPQPPDGGALPLVPAPRAVEVRAGAFAIGAATALYIVGPEAVVRAMADPWAGRIRTAAGVPLPVRTGEPAGADAIVVRLAGTGDAPGERWDPGDESYVLDVTSSHITLTAAEPPGLFRGLQTLRKLLPPHVEAGRRAPPDVRFAVPALRIEDSPRFAYRGLHLDVGRHFFPPEFVRRYIDLMALWGYNAFHWHLTEDQGWRIEIRAYPRLTEVGAYRRETMLGRNFDPYVGDGVPHGGFYTQDEVHDIVAYAAARHITIVPEIEMPGHSLAALAAYPELACTEGPFEVATGWGVFDDIVCPSERTFEFFETVLAEVIELFPGRYIHIGGDEAPKTRWEESALAQEVIRREGLADAHELQSWFIRRIERFLLANGRRLIGWDEILEGGLAPEATVMSWRGVEGGIAAARAGHDVIMTPNSHVYLDYYQGDPAHEPLAIGGFSTLAHVYAFEPVPPALSPDEARHILGGQGNVWTEYMKTTSRVEYMAYPRALALAEVLWSPPERREWSDFMARLGPSLQRLDALGVGYRVPDVTGLEEEVLSLEDHANVWLGPVWDGADVRYTLDGTTPTPRSPRYDGPFRLDLSGGTVTVSARVVMRDGRQSDVRTARFRRTALRAAAAVDGAQPGLVRERIEGRFTSVDELAARTGARDVANGVALPDGSGAQPYALRLTGFLRAPEDGIYAFHLASDDGSRMTIGGDLVVDNDGPHAPREHTGRIALAAGLHPVRIDYFQGGGGSALSLEVTLPSGRRVPVPAEWLVHLAAAGGQEAPGYAFAACEPGPPAWEPGPLRSVYVTMRDGVRIALDVVAPAAPPGTRFPTILTMTRYWRGREGAGPREESERFARMGYVHVYGDSRGTGASFGVWPHHRARDETLDFGEIVDWIVAQPWSDGNVGSWGTSYTANTADWVAERNHPAVKAIVPRFPDFDPYTDLYFPGGILQTGFSTRWSESVKALDLNVPRGEPPRGVRPVDADSEGALLAEAVRRRRDVPDLYRGLSQVTYRDDTPDVWGMSFEDWSIQFQGAAVQRAGTPIQTWGSWFDAGTADGVLRRFMSWSNPIRAIIGAWSHGGDEHASPYLPVETTPDPPYPRQFAEDLCFFDQHLKGADHGMDQRLLVYYTMGEERWKTTRTWPPAGSGLETWHFAADGGLSRQPPAVTAANDEYRVDFAATTGVKNRWYTQLGGDNDVVYADRAEQDRRLLTYTSEPLARDVEITGHPVVVLHFTATTDDAAFFVYLEDVAPDGTVRYLAEGQLRALHRKVSSDPAPYVSAVPYHSFRRADGSPLVPGEVAEVRFGLLPTSALVRAGHRIRIAIAGADRDSFVRIPAEATPVFRVHRDAARASRIELPVIRR